MTGDGAVGVMTNKILPSNKKKREEEEARRRKKNNNNEQHSFC